MEMMNKVNQLRIRADSELEQMDNQALFNELRQATAITASNLVYMAKIWGQLESRGVDMAPFRSGLLRFLPMIASGQLVPEAVIKFAGNMTLLNNVGKLPPAQQKALAEGEPVPVVDAKTGMVRERKAEELSAKEARQVFAVNGKLRDVEQQRRLTAHEPHRKLAGPKIQINEVKQTIKVGTQEVTISDLLTIMRQHGYRISKTG